MLTIYKYHIPLADTFTLELPTVRCVLTVQEQDEAYRPDSLCIWAHVDTEAPKRQERLHIVGTGHPIDFPLETPYIGTVQMGPRLWHVFGPEPQSEP